MAQKEENSILVRVAKLLRLSIYRIQPVHDHLALITQAVSEGSDEAVHMHSLIRALAARTCTFIKRGSKVWFIPNNIHPALKDTLNYIHF